MATARFDPALAGDLEFSQDIILLHIHLLKTKEVGNSGTRKDQTMIAEFSLLNRRADEIPAQFRAALMAHHAGKDHAAAGGRILNFVTDSTQKAIEYQRGRLEVDALSQRLSPGLASAGQEAEPGWGATLTAFRHVILPPPVTGPSVKRMSFLRRRPDVAAQSFEHEWFDLHSVLVRRLPGLLGYRQNLVIGHQGNPAAEEIDGIVELWFADTAALETAFRTDAGTTLMTHAKEFIGAITTFMVDPVELAAEPLHQPGRHDEARRASHGRR